MGNYVLLNPIYSDDNTDNEACYEPGDEVTVHFRSGEEGTYTVMAIVERLPVSLAFPSLTLEGDMYLPMRTWQEMEKERTTICMLSTWKRNVMKRGIMLWGIV